MYSYNKETLQFEPNKNFKKIILIIIFLLIGLCLTLSSAISKNKMISQLEAKSKTQHKIINVLQNKPKDSAEEYKFFRSSLGKSIDPTKQEENRLKHLYFKYKDLIDKHHCPHNLLWYIAFKESRLDLNAKNSKSTASGLFQFILGTWQNMCKRGGMDTCGRFNETKQVEVMCIYLDYLFNKYKDWKKVHREYCGGVILYTLPYYN
jgi:hypothetical protein